MAATASIISGMVLSGLGSAYGSYSQGNANKDNLNFQQQHQNLIQGYANQMMQPGMNPFGQAMLNFIGQGLPIGISSFSPGGYQPISGGGAPGSGGSGGGVTGGTGGQGSGGAGGSGDAGGGALQGANQNQVTNTGQQGLAGGGPQIPGYTGGFTPQYSNIGGVDVSQYLGQGMRMSDLVSKGIVTQAQVNQLFGNPADYDPKKDQGMLDQYNQWVKGNAGAGFGAGGPPDFDTWYNTFGQGGTNLDAYTANNPQAMQAALANAPKQQNGGYVDAQGNYVPPNTNPSSAIYIQNGQVIDGNGKVLGPAPSSDPSKGGQLQFVNGQLTYTAPNGTATGAGSGGGGGTGGGGGGAGGPGQYGGQSGPTLYGQGSNMAPYQQINPFTYNPTTLGQAPLIGNAPGVQAQQIQAPQASISNLFQGAQANFTPGIQTPTVAATGTQALNAGQDALMQMMTRNLTPASDPSLNTNLQRLGSGVDQYDTSSLFKLIQDQSKQNLEQQVAALQGSAGSLGQRFGTAMTNAESQLRRRATTDLNAQEQQIGMQSFQNAQAMRQPALNLSADLLNQMNQMGQFNAGQQQQAASSLAGYGQQDASLNLQAALANASNALSAQSQNQNLGAQMAQFNAGNQQQAGLSGQSLLAQLAQFNAGQGFNASQQNAQLGLQGQQSNLDALMRSALANQNVLAQYGTSNANIMNQAGQFNAGQGMSAAGFNSQQANTYNNLILNALSNAGGLQSNQSSYNASLLGILNSVGVPQVQPNQYGQVISQIGQMGMLYPFLSQMGGGGGGGAASYNPANTSGRFAPSGSGY